MSPPPGRRRVTLADVAVSAEVDRSVVSRVLNDDPRLSIRPETRERVLTAVRELGYRRNAMARSLRTQRAEAFGFVIPTFENPIYASIIQGAEREAERRGLALLTSSAEHESFSVASLVDLAGQGRIDGLLLAVEDDVDTIDAELDALAIPWMLVNRRSPKARRWAILDDEGAARIAVEHLVQLGHRRIAHLAGPPGADTASRREDGYGRAMADAGLEVGSGFVLPSDYTNEGGASALRRLLDGPAEVTAVFAANVAAAIGALGVAHERGVRVPDDLSIVAVHDLPLAGYLNPPLTTVRMPLQALGERAVGLLSDVPARERLHTVVRGPMELVVRKSTAAPRPVAP